MTANAATQGPSPATYPALRRLERSRRRGRIPYVPQMQMAECGAACLAMVLRFLGRDTRLEDVRAVMGIGRDGASVAALREAGEYYGLRVRALRTDVQELRLLPRGSILHVDLAHFVVFDRATKRGLKVVDPGTGPRLMTWDQVSKRYSGIAVTLETTQSFAPLKAGGNRLVTYLRTMLSSSGGLGRVLTMSVMRMPRRSSMTTTSPRASTFSFTTMSRGSSAPCPSSRTEFRSSRSRSRMRMRV